MRDRQRKTVARALAGREGFLQVILIGLLLALGTNVLATAVTSSMTQSTAAVVGILLVGVVGVLSIRAASAARELHRSFEAAVVLSPDDLQPRATEVYQFSEDITRILKAVFHENTAFAEAWQREPVTKQWDLDIHSGTFRRGVANAGLALLHEALETWLIHILSVQLTDYYGHLEESERYTVKFERQHVPSLLLQNRVLNLLSTPVADRAVFISSSPREGGEGGERGDDGTVYSQFGPDGALFERFELVLPRGSRLSRQKSGALTIDTPRLHLSLSARHKGFAASLPFRFVSRYFDLDPTNVHSLLVHIELAGRVKPLGLLRGQGWELYHWVDDFADRIEEAGSVEAMLRRICWPALEALLIAEESHSARREGA